MSETEKQEGQKTVVAFITGLLIGGLLLWVFSSSPETKVAETSTPVDGVETTEVTTDTETTEVTKAEVKPAITIGEGSLKASDQTGGATVTLDETVFPTNAGWVAVRDYMDGIPGNVIGAARYNLEEGLVPTEVSLRRNTVAGSSYQVVFYTDNGDKVFDLGDDVVIEGMDATFVAQ